MIGGAFLGGRGEDDIPVGQCLLKLQIMTEDRSNLAGTFTISDGTNTYTKVADADGRAEQMVISGSTYTVSVSTTGYDNTSPQRVIASSQTVQYVRFEMTKKSVKYSDAANKKVSDRVVFTSGIRTDAFSGIWESSSDDFPESSEYSIKIFSLNGTYDTNETLNPPLNVSSNFYKGKTEFEISVTAHKNTLEFIPFPAFFRIHGEGSEDFSDPLHNYIECSSRPYDNSHYDDIVTIKRLEERLASFLQIGTGEPNGGMDGSIYLKKIGDGTFRAYRKISGSWVEII